MSVPKVRLNNGLEMPVIAFGTLQIPIDIAANVIKEAINIGYRHFDCAYFYGNEIEIGKGIAAKIRDGTVKREDLFICSKLWNTFHSRELVVPTCKKSLENLGLQYLDLYLIHWPMGFQEGRDSLLPRVDGVLQVSDVDYMDTWEGMEDCVFIGLAKSIGLSNFNSKQLDRIMLNAKVYPVTLQVECNPYLNQQTLISYCDSYGVVLTAYCSLRRPSDPDKGTPPDLFKEVIIRELTSKYGKSAGQLILRYLIQIGTVPISKTTNKQKMEENANIFNFNLTPEDMQLMNSLNKNIRLYVFPEMAHHKYYPFNIEF